MLKRSVLFPLLTLVLFSCSLQNAESSKLNTTKSFSRYNIELTENEQKWLEQNPIVKARVGANPPLHFYDGQYRGISVDYLNRIGEIVGFKVEYVHGIPWYEAIEEIKKGKKFDLLLTAKNTKERQAYMRFSDDYLLMPWVIFSRIKSDFISSIDDLNGRTVAVEKSFVMQKLLMTEYPDINLVVRKHSPEALEAVASGEADAYIGNLATSTYLINRYNLTNLKVACPALFGDHNQAFAVRYDWPEFVSILNKAIKAIPARELTELRNKWFNVKFEYGVSKTDLFKWVGIVIGASSILLLFFVFWNQRLKKEIRERKAALQAVETSARQYHGMLQSTMDGFWIIDKDGMIVDVNNTICEMLGYTRDQLLTMSLADVEVEENDEDVRQHIKKIITTGYDRFESRHKRKDGAVLDVEISSTYIQEPNAYFCTFIRDITERKQAEVNLRESENRHRTLFESMVQGIVYQDRTGTIISANPAAENILGLTLDQMVGRTSVDPRWKTIHEDGSDFPGDTHPAMVSLKSGKPVKNVIMGVSNPQNQKHTWVIVNSMPRFNTGENVPYQVYTTFENITERKKAEAENLKLNERLQQAQKMEAIGTLAGGIAHDFNNILAAILGYAEMAKDDIPPESTVANDLDKVLEGGNRAKDLVQQILAFSRQGESKRIPLQPVSVLKEAIKMLRPSLPTTIAINQDIVSITGLILADPTQIHQILMNLCTNSFHAMEETGGKLDITLKEITLGIEDLIHEPGVEVGTFVQLSISDTGPGIPPDIKKKIFDPYFTTKDPGKGTGMGLAIVHGIVKSYGGFISLYSEPREGTAFHVFLPVIEQELLAEVKDVEPIPVGRDRILLIDDEEILAEMGKSMLERLGYHVTVRNNSIEALETFQNQPDQFDLVITDQTMPGMTGADIARRMIQIRPDIPIILCTGYSTTISEEKAKSMGIKEFALKPLSKKDIAMLIRKVLDNNQA